MEDLCYMRELGSMIERLSHGGPGLYEGLGCKDPMIVLLCGRLYWTMALSGSHSTSRVESCPATSTVALTISWKHITRKPTEGESPLVPLLKSNKSSLWSTANSFYFINFSYPAVFLSYTVDAAVDSLGKDCI